MPKIMMLLLNDVTFDDEDGGEEDDTGLVMMLIFYGEGGDDGESGSDTDNAVMIVIILTLVSLDAQIFLTLRLDDSISWSYAKVGSPLLIWMGLRLLVHFYEVECVILHIYSTFIHTPVPVYITVDEVYRYIF